MNLGFWNKLPKSFAGLAPMDGVTDFLYRDIMQKYSKPDLMITEFTAVEGIAHNALKLLKDFEYEENHRPIVAQVFGIDPDSFYTTAIILCEYGFDGIDINMGCPAKKIKRRGAGAALIENPKLASQIIEATKKGILDYSNGKGLNDLDIKMKMKKEIRNQIGDRKNDKKKVVPLSVKTRIGFGTVVIEEWVKYLLQHDLSAITIHGRTLNQMYGGEANWDIIGKAAKIIKQTDTLVLGNGDVLSRADGEEKCKKYGIDGVLIGRATFGNPWVFKNHVPTIKERIDLAIFHCQKFEKLYGTEHFYVMRKHLGWYIKGIPGAKKIRKELMLVNSTEDVKKILKDLN